MHTRTKLALAALAATLLMSLAVSTATANHLSTSNQNFTIAWSALTFEGHGGLINPTVRCPLTLEGSFHSATIAKVEASLVGYITRVAINSASCTGGHLTILTATLPWHVTYRAFTGTLPRITGLVYSVHTTAFLIEIGSGTSCLYAENGTQPAAGTANREAGGGITGVTPNAEIRLSLLSGSGCPPEAGFEGTGTVSVLGSTTRISVSLI